MVLVLAALALEQPACSSANRAAARRAADIASVSCVVLRGPLDDGDIEEICATEAELAPYVKDVLLSRLRMLVGTGGGVPANTIDACPLR